MNKRPYKKAQINTAATATKETLKALFAVGFITKPAAIFEEESAAPKGKGGKP